MSFQDEIKKLRELAIINEDVKKILERMTGKELVSYEGIDALIKALMIHYNGELKKKAQTSHSHSWSEVTDRPSAFPPTSHTHDDRYCTKTEINDKFTKYCPYKIGDIYITTNSSNPSSVYLGTTWQKIINKYIRANDETTSLRQGGANSIKISKSNLPAEKLQIDNFNLSTGTLKIIGSITNIQTNTNDAPSMTGAFYASNSWSNGYAGGSEKIINLGFDSTRSGATSGSLGGASPYTENMGLGTALNIEPEYATFHIWKRTS